MKYIQSISILTMVLGMTLSSFNATALNAKAEDLNMHEVEALLDQRMDGLSHAQVHGLTVHLFKLCRESGFSVSSILSVISTESSFDKDAISSVGAIGLMQVMPKTAGFIARKAGIRTYRRANDLHDPQINLSVGVAYLSYLRDKYTQSHHYLAAYNMGPTKFNRMVKKHAPRPASVSKYVTDIHSGVYQIRREAQELAYAH